MRPNDRKQGGRPGRGQGRGPRRRDEEDASALRARSLEQWVPKTVIGKKVKSKEITDISQVIGEKIREPEVIDALLPDLEVDYILIGQAHGKFGGGKRRLVRQTQKKTAEGNKPNFQALAIVGNKNGYVGFGIGNAKETIPAKEKAVRNAKMSITQVARGCGSWKCACGEPHSLPFKVDGKCGSVRVSFMPAPRGTGLVVENEIKKIMKLAGISDLWAKSNGQTRKRLNFVKACMQALNKASTMRLRQEEVNRVRYGKVSAKAQK